MAYLKYPVVVHKDKDSDYGVTVPDLPGCFSAGNTLKEALHHMVREAIELHMEDYIYQGRTIPQPGTIEEHQKNP